RCAGFQDRGYARLYLDRLEPIVNLDHAASGYQLTNETGRFLALWMCYEDVIRVADLKTRRSRFERVREEVQAKPHEPLHIIEFLKPGVDEFTAVLPRFLARPLKALAEASGLAKKLNIGMPVKTTTVSGFLALRFLAWLRPLRPLTSRWHEEQTLIGRWLVAIATAAKRDVGLALEIALCGRLLKGYGETHERGKGNFLRILDTLVEGDAVPADRARIDAIRKAREAALADPEGRKLELSLEMHGIAPLPPRPKPVKFMRRPQPENRRRTLAPRSDSPYPVTIAATFPGSSGGRLPRQATCRSGRSSRRSWPYTWRGASSGTSSTASAAPKARSAFSSPDVSAFVRPRRSSV